MRLLSDPKLSFFSDPLVYYWPSPIFKLPVPRPRGIPWSTHFSARYFFSFTERPFLPPSPKSFAVFFLIPFSVSRPLSEIRFLFPFLRPTLPPLSLSTQLYPKNFFFQITYCLPSSLSHRRGSNSAYTLYMQVSGFLHVLFSPSGHIPPSFFLPHTKSFFVRKWSFLGVTLKGSLSPNSCS